MPPTKHSDLPLYPLFDVLRREGGFELGLKEYFAVLEAMQAGFGLQSFADQLALCKLLWAKSAEQALQLEYLFHIHVVEAAGVRVKAEKTDAPLQPVTPDPNEQQPPNPDPNDPQDLSAQSHQKDPQPIAPKQPTKAPQPEALQASNLGVSTVSFRPTTGQRRFLLEARFVPASDREMVQGWRKLRQLHRSGPKTETDLEATVADAARRGQFEELHLRAPLRNLARLHILMDRDGSMTPFHPLGDQIVNAIEKGGGLGEPELRYFHDVPESHVYATPKLNSPQRFVHWLSRLDLRHSYVVILSDAGAARGKLDPGRAEVSHWAYLNIFARCRRVAWLNPMPRARWANTTAALIAEQVPMYEANGQGMRDLVDYLRGYSHPYTKGAGQ